MPHPYQAILLIAFGGPTRAEEIRPFLARVTHGMQIPPARLDEVVRHYEAVGGKSPLNEITFRQADSLKTFLNNKLPVYVGMRNAAPYLVDTLKLMASAGVARALGFILSSHRSEASWERYQRNIADARAELGGSAPEVDYCDGWHDHRLFIQSWVEQIQTAMTKIEAGKRQSTALVFTAHSLPAAMADRSPYVEQLTNSARLIAAALNHSRWSLAYQSRSGRPGDPWLEPDIGQTIRELAAHGDKRIIVAPIGFVCDHVEVLYDLDIEAKTIADGLGVELIRTSCPNDHPTFVRMMADVIDRQLKKAAARE
ncbi:MAG TPA: ferrochelatase [Candidatus Limnocylindria bacterium]|nr:ferrochelatase [Candidatus Limnocylindria bacterium]